MLTLEYFFVGVAAAAVSASFKLLPYAAEGAVLGEVAISQITATPDRAGNTTVMTFSGGNVRSEPIPYHGSTHADWRAGAGHGDPWTRAERRGRLAAGRPDAAVRKVWIEVGARTQDFEPDNTIPARQVLGSYESLLALHVGPVAAGSTESTILGGARIASRSPATKRHSIGC